MSLYIEITESSPGYHEVVLRGSLDTETYEDFEDRITKLLELKVKAVRIDMSCLHYLSSMGLRVLLTTFRQLRERKALFLAAEVQPQITKVLEIAAALPEESIFASVEEADKYLDSIQRKVLEGDDDEDDDE